MASGGEAINFMGDCMQAAHGRRGSGCAQELLEDSYGSFRCSSLLPQLHQSFRDHPPGMVTFMTRLQHSPYSYCNASGYHNGFCIYTYQFCPSIHR